MTTLLDMERKLLRARTGRAVGTTLHEEMESGLDQQFPRLKKHVKRDGMRIIAGAHVFDAMLAYLLTRSEDEQLAILAAGRDIMGTLEQGPNVPLMPGTYGSVKAGDEGRRAGRMETSTGGDDDPGIMPTPSPRSRKR